VPRTRRLPTLRTALRKTVKWGGAAGTVILVAVWVGSRWGGVIWGLPGGGFMAVRGGQCLAVVSPMQRYPTVRGGLSLVLSEPYFRWRFYGEYRSGRITLSVPLWFPATILLALTAFAWRRDAVWHRRARAGVCPTCGYDLSGLPAKGGCPECGAPAPPLPASTLPLLSPPAPPTTPA